jgi:ATP-dependent helicase/nuclease subunit B
LGEKKRVQAHFLLGPAGSGKTFRCLAEVRAGLRASPDGPPLVLLAPKQATFQLERQLLADAELSGYSRLNIFSFERLARFVLGALGVPPPAGLLAEEGRTMVLRALLRRHERALKLFGPSARRPGFAAQLSQLLGELQQHQCPPARLRALAQRAGPGGELQHKLQDLALLLDAYARWLAEHELQDGNRLLDAATEALRSHSALRTPSTLRGSATAEDGHSAIQSLWLDGFAEMTPQELNLLAGILPHCQRATLAFCLAQEPEPGASWLSLWSPIGKTVSPAIRFCGSWRQIGQRPPGARSPEPDPQILPSAWSRVPTPAEKPCWPHAKSCGSSGKAGDFAIAPSWCGPWMVITRRWPAHSGAMAFRSFSTGANPWRTTRSPN